MTGLNHFTLSHCGSRTPLPTLKPGLTASAPRLSTSCLPSFTGLGVSPNYTARTEPAHPYRPIIPCLLLSVQSNSQKCSQCPHDSGSHSLRIVTTGTYDLIFRVIFSSTLSSLSRAFLFVWQRYPHEKCSKLSYFCRNFKNPDNSQKKEKSSVPCGSEDFSWWRLADSNCRPPACEAGALTS